MNYQSSKTRGLQPIGVATSIAMVAAATMPMVFVGAEVLADSTPVIVFQHSGCGAMMPDENDAGLRRALGMLTDRLAELPGEIQRMSHNQDAAKAMWIADRILPLLTATFEYPAEWAVLDNGINDFGVSDFDARVVFDTGSHDEAEKLQNIVSGLFQMAIPNSTLQAAESNANFLEFPTPVATLLFGPVDDGGQFALGFDLGGDGIRTNRIALKTPSELGGVKAVYQFHLDGQGMMDLINTVAGMAPNPSFKEQLQAFMEQMAEGDIYLDIAGGFKDGRALSVTKMTNFKELQGILAQHAPGFAPGLGFISPDLLKSVPVDARMASAANQDVKAIINGSLQQAANASQGQFDPETVFAQVQMQVGIHPIHDFIDYLGSNWVSYTSDSTGGGGWMSLVFLNEGVDSDGLQATFDKLSNMANAIGSSQAMGYVRCQAWDGDQWKTRGLKAGYTLTFPGLPVPFELSMGLTDNSLVAALTPQAVRTAALQATGQRRGSILNNPRFAESFSEKLKQVNKVSFIDTEASLARGYPMAQLFGTAVANFVRSPIDPARDPGMVVPTYDDLARGARGAIQMAYIDGEDYVLVSSSDASWLVNIAGISGSLGITPEVIGAGALGVAIGSNLP